MTWIEDEAKKVKREDEQKQRDKDWALHKSKVLSDRAGDIWKALLERVREDVRALNAQFAGDDARQAIFHEVPAWGLTVTKEGRPFVNVTVSMQPGGRGIKILTRKVRNTLASPIEDERTIQIDLDEHETLQFDGYPDGVAGVSKSVVQEVLQAFRG